MRKRWFSKLIACSFYIPDYIAGNGFEGEYVFCGACEHSDHDKRRDKLQYEFYSEGMPVLLLGYKEARIVMGSMIDNNK